MALFRTIAKYHLDIRKGLTPTSGYILDAFAAFDPTQVSTISNGFIPKGRCVHMASDGELELGVRESDLALFLLSNSDDPDVSFDGVGGSGDPSVDPQAYSGSTPSKRLRAAVSLGNFELS